MGLKSYMLYEIYSQAKNVRRLLCMKSSEFMKFCFYPIKTLNLLPYV